MRDTTDLRHKRMIVVSNRLPFSVTDEGANLRFIPSVGGLATGLSSYLNLLSHHPAASQDYLWFGWPGSTIREDKKEEVRERSLSEFNAVPVFLTEQEIEKFYQGFCNKTIWPLFHYFQVYTNYDEDDWSYYVDVNRSFGRTLLEMIGPEDTLWIHDFHLMLLPGMIRDQSPSARIGFFLHIPFPNFEIFRLLPSRWRREILKGLLGADLIGFHTNDYKQDFLRCVIRILGHDSVMGEMIVGDRIVKAETFPMGIDYAKYHDGSCDPAIRRERGQLRGRLGEAKVVLSIDRLDYTKGIVNRLEGFQTFLENYPMWKGKVVLILLVVPSRTDVEHYEMMKGQIEALVGRINGQFGSPHWTPIIYMFRTLTFSPLCALYSASHVALVTPLRDGMNLIAKEYVASRTDQTGVLILSEMAGASKELVEAIIINPNNRQEIAEALVEALDMPEEEQVRRITTMQKRLQQHTVLRWASDFMEELENTIETRRKYYAKVLGPNIRANLVQHCRQSRRRLFMLDYDGTLIPFSASPHDALPSQSLIDVLRELSQEPRNEVVIISGRKRAFLDEWFSKLPISLIAEHGAWFKEKDSDWQRSVTAAIDWKPKLKPLLERYVDRVVGSIVEEKDFALVWHYRGAEPEPGKLAAQELKDHLLALTANIDVHVLQGNKTVEVRVAGVNKGTGGRRFLSRDSYDFILCIGDDISDEDLFAVLPETAYSIRIGLGGTYAKHTIINVEDVAQLLYEMALPDIH
jgi:trehalose 6-phosphate synthase/phosphatase